MAFPDNFIEELIERNDIVDVVGAYVDLKKKSGSNQFGLCPFHSERTPSFSVSSDKQMYYCFGCHKGGGVINFIMDIENLAYHDAVHFLADRVGMTVPADARNENAIKHRERILKLNKAAAHFFHENLSKPCGSLAVEYINKRGISKAMVKRFGIGVAPDSWDALGESMISNGFTGEELIAAGLQKRGKKTQYDTFRNRLVFPVIDVRGSVIGFSGRSLDDSNPKYLNSPDTVVFNKSRNLFGLNLAKKSKSEHIILVEGNIDVVTLHQVGFDSAVAALGTAFTENQARLIARYTEKVIIAFDSDTAGVNASSRAIGILEKTGIQVRVLTMHGAKDPDEYIKKKGADGFSILIDQSENHTKYRLAGIRAKYDLDNEEQKISFLHEATVFLATITDRVKRELYTRSVAESAGVSYEGLDSDISKAIKDKRFAEKRKFEQRAIRPERTNQPADKSLRYESPKTALAEEGIIRLLLKDSELFTGRVQVDQEDFSNSALRKIYSALFGRLREGKSLAINSMPEEFTSAEISLLAEIESKEEDISNGKRLLDDYINKIKLENLKSDPDVNLRDIFEKYRSKKGVEVNDDKK